MIFDGIELFVCTFEIDDGRQKQTQTIKAPRFALEQQFISYVQQISQIKEPVKVKMYRIVQIYDNFDKKWVDREISVAFANKSYEEKYGG